MKTKLSSILSFLLLLCITTAYAQEKTIAGEVLDESGLPLPGVNIIVKNTINGTQTDFDGKYTINASIGQVLVYSYVGFNSQEVTITDSTNTINVTLNEDSSTLEEVVVTAQGIKREKKALGYAVSEVSNELIEQKPEGDVGRILQGKTAGVSIGQSSGASGSGTRVNIRGIIDPTGNNNPLWVIDGIPISSTTNGSGRFESSRTVDIDPNNIESVNILKGISATTLYGSDGRNGVILITTKNGRDGNVNKKSEISITQSVFVNQIASLPEFSQRRGRGYYGLFYNFLGNWGADFGTVGQFGIDEDGNIPHPLSNSANALAAFPEFADAVVPYQRFNGHEDFFKDGIVSSTNISASGGGENTSYNVSYGKLNDEGFLPNNKLERDNISLGGTMKLSNNFTINGNMNVAFTKFRTPFTGSILSSLYNVNTNYDLLGLPFQNPNDGTEIFYDDRLANPLWLANNTGSSQNTNRVNGKLQASYKFNDMFNLTYRFTVDSYTELESLFINRGANNEIFVGANPDTNGRFRTAANRERVFDHALILNFQKDLNEEFKLTSELGVTSRRTTFSTQGADSFGQDVFGFHEHANFSDQTAFSARSEVNRPAAFGQFTLDYDNKVFLTGNARNEWTSNFNNNSQFFYGGSVAVLPTAIFSDLKGDFLNFMKLRAAYGSSAGFAGGFPTFSNLLQDTNAFIDTGGTSFTSFSIPNTLNNPNINPFTIEELEFGLEVNLLNNRIKFNGSYFDRVTNDLIFQRPFDPSIGVTSQTQNVNEFTTDGLELELNITPVRTDSFEWNTSMFFTKLNYEVTDIGDDERIQFVSANGGSLGNYLIEGESLLTIMGTVASRDDNGNLIVQPDGDGYEVSDEIEILGDANPDFTSSLINTFKYKGLSFNMLWQYQHGGDFVSNTASTLLSRGLSAATDNIDAETGLILPGVFADGTPNNIVQDVGDLYLNVYGAANEFSVFDATTIRLQEVSLSYDLPKKFLNNTPIGNLSLTFSGQNLWFRAVNVPKELNVDTNAIGTNVSGNGSGFETISSPSSRRYGFSVRATF